MNLDEILDQLNKLTAQVKDMQSGEVIEEDGFVERIIDDGNSYTLKATAGYNKEVDKLCELTDTGNGYIAHFPSYSNTIQDNYICMGYDEAEYLRKLLSYIHKESGG
jgi:hypothetical protein